MPKEMVDEENPGIGEQVFQPFVDPEDPYFDDIARIHVYDIVRSRNMHKRTHTPTCFKYGNKRKCRARYPRKLIKKMYFDPETGVVELERDDEWLVGYNSWLSLMMRANHDGQFLFTKNHALSVIHYIMKYISKPEDSLHSKLAIAAAVRKEISVANTNRSADFDLGKSMLIKTANKLDSHREVGLPEIVSHLLDFPDHYTGASFRKLHTTQLLKYITLAYGGDPSNSHHQTTARHAELSEWESEPQSQDTPGSDNDPAPVVDGLHDDPPQSEIVASKGQLALISKFDDYALRGDDLAECCLYDYCSLFYKKKAQSSGFPFDDGHKQHHSYRQFFSEPTIPALLGRILFVRKDSPDRDVRSQYFCLVSALFIPWSHTNPLKRPEAFWEQVFYGRLPTLSSRIRRYIDNLDLLHKSKEESRIDRLQQKAQQNDGDYFSYDDEYKPDVHRESYDSDFDDLNDDEEYSPNIERVVALLKETAPELYIHEGIDAGWDNNYFHSDSDAPVTAPTPSTFPTFACTKTLEEMSREMDAFMNALLPRTSAGSRFIDPVHPHIFLTDGTEIARGVQAIIQQFSLNDDQAFAFQIIADQTIGRSKVGSQLRMGIFGEGGTGKSRLIDAIRAWFKFCRREEELVVTATTGAAASKINGTTLHSATGISFSKKKRRSDEEDVHVTKKMKDWTDRNCMIVDEMSMMDTDVIASASTKLGHAKSMPSEKFGGVNVIFMGDFLQLASVSSRDLYIDNAKTRTGHDIWRSLNAVVILRHQIRQAGDPRYAQLLHRLRFHQPTDEDLDLLDTRVGVAVPSHLDLPVIVRRHNLRYAINIEKIHQVSQETGVPIIYCVANVLKREGGMSMDAALAARYSASSSIAGDAILPILPGTPLMLTQNFNIPLGIVPIVIFADSHLQASSMEPSSNSMDSRNMRVPPTILSLRLNIFSSR